MPEHVHIVVHPRRPVYDMAEIREQIKEPVGRAAVRHLREHAPAPEWLPRIQVVKRDRVRYHFWQKGGGFDLNIIEPKTLFQMIDYIHMNPVRRGLAVRARDWKWSSAAWFEGNGESPVPLGKIPLEWTITD